MVSKRIFIEEELKGLPELPDGYQWILFSSEPCIAAGHDPHLAWVTMAPFAVDGEPQYHWDYYPQHGEKIRYREPVSFDDAINAITNIVWLNHTSTP